MPQSQEEYGIKEADLAEEAVERVADQTTEQPPSRQLFGTFGGVFVPTLLTILGVIMYLREGWVVGNAGLGGAWLVILLSFGITAFTGLSLASITTNIRIGAGGAFNIISQSLGLEVGGSIGIPLYFSQALAVAMYIFGFRAGWTWIFPDHSPLVVDLLVFAALFAIAFVSAGLAFKVQYLILAIIIASLVAVAWAGFSGSMTHQITWWGDFRGSPETGFTGIGFWAVFAVFFPASTGIMAGANMSGDLKNPRRSIPVGTLGAIALSLIIYLALAWWLAASASVEELTGNYTIMIERAAWGPAVLAGLLGATFSSALSSLVGAPRILQALAEHGILPVNRQLAKKTQAGEPRHALFLTGAIVLAALMLRDLNAIAPLITMFFLITYAMINLVVLIEQNLHLVSFRPLLRIPRLVSLLGAAGCVLAMVIVNPTFSFAAVTAVIVLHAWLVRRRLDSPYSDVRSGLFTAMAEWAAKKAQSIAASRERTWKANLLAPIQDGDRARDFIPLWRAAARPKGFVRLLGLTGKEKAPALREELEDLAQLLREADVFSTWTVVEAAQFSENLAAGFEALDSALITSNLLFLRLTEDRQRDPELAEVIAQAAKYDSGVLLYVDPQDEPPPHEGGKVAVWLDRPEQGWRLTPDLGNLDLAILVGYKLADAWKAGLHVLARVEDPGRRDEARQFLETLLEMARLPGAQAHTVDQGGEAAAAAELAPAISLLCLPPDPDLAALREAAKEMGTPCLFAQDSGLENVLA